MISVFDHAWLSGLFGHREAQDIWRPERQLQYFIEFEVALTRAHVTVGRVDTDRGEAAVRAMEASRLDVDELRNGTAQDGLPIPNMVRQLRQVATPHEDAVHIGATSQDVLDTALSLSLQAVSNIIELHLSALVTELDGLISIHGPNPLIGRTRMQAALPITVADRLRTWKRSLVNHKERLSQVRTSVERLQIGG
ncbi:MAG: lyase family protein, partial [Pseudomonadota bacterium]